MKTNLRKLGTGTLLEMYRDNEDDDALRAEISKIIREREPSIPIGLASKLQGPRRR